MKPLSVEMACLLGIQQCDICSKFHVCKRILYAHYAVLPPKNNVPITETSTMFYNQKVNDHKKYTSC